MGASFGDEHSQRLVLKHTLSTYALALAVLTYYFFIFLLCVCGEEGVRGWGGGQGGGGRCMGDEHLQRLVLNTQYQLMPRISCAYLGAATGPVDPHQLSQLTSARVPLIN